MCRTLQESYTGPTLLHNYGTNHSWFAALMPASNLKPACLAMLSAASPKAILRSAIEWGKASPLLTASVTFSCLMAFTTKAVPGVEVQVRVRLDAPSSASLLSERPAGKVMTRNGTDSK